ncbi:MAG: sigma-54-dependent Fis family transcriptional regulator, partial [Calditrichaeota bacterium]|nr:sigma-54-dependent Fis family transcriptional regulator [Calditrichota bacterium]
MNKTVLIVDDEANIRRFTAKSFEKLGYTVYASESAEAALDLFKTTDIHVMITDKRLPGIDGIELIKQSQTLENPPLSIMMTAYSDVESAVEAMKAGAKDFISKPFDSDDLIALCKPLFDYIDLLKERDVLKAQVQQKSYYNIVGSSKKMNQVYTLISKVAKTNSTVLITGETGTGKELVARAIHDQSDRKNDPFIAINCTTISENILES